MGGIGKKRCENPFHLIGRKVATDATNENVFELFGVFCEDCHGGVPNRKTCKNH